MHLWERWEGLLLNDGEAAALHYYTTCKDDMYHGSVVCWQDGHQRSTSRGAVRMWDGIKILRCGLQERFGKENMPRLTADQWESARAMREAGASLREVGVKFGVSDAAILKRAKIEGWGDGSDIAETIRRKVSEKVSGLVSIANPKKKAEAIDAAAEQGAAIIRMHQAEWVDHRDRFGSVPADFDDGKLMKITSEALTIRQRGERIAHGLDDDKAVPSIVIERSYGVKP